MTVEPETIAVIGSSPFAVFLAGLVAADQSRKVALVRDPAGGGSPADCVDLSLAPLTRPDSWALLEYLVPEALRHLEGFDQPVLERHDLVIRASGEAARTALDHIAHMAGGSAVTAESLAAMNDATTLRLRGQRRLVRHAFEEQSTSWLSRMGVAEISACAFEGVNADGSCRAGGKTFDLTVLADDAALAALGPVSELARAGHFARHVWLLSQPVPPIVHGSGMDLDSGTLVFQRSNGAVELLGPGLGETLPATIAPFLAGAKLRLAGRAHADRFVPFDGAPIIGTTRRSRAIVLSGLGSTALMFAPALARFVAGTANPAEVDWCTARRATRGPKTAAVAEPLLRSATVA